jgi:hypothetical protein
MRRRSPRAANDSRGVVSEDIDAYDGIGLGTSHQWLESTEISETEVTFSFEQRRSLGLIDAQALGHFVIQEAFAGAVGLDPFAVNHELRDGALTRLLDHFIGGSGRAFDIDFLERDTVLLQEAFGFAALRAPDARYRELLSS